jgi:hypothetical protein
MILLVALAATSCTTDYVCVCTYPAEDTVLTETTSYPGLKKDEAEIVRVDCLNAGDCSWREDM